MSRVAPNKLAIAPFFETNMGQHIGNQLALQSMLNILLLMVNSKSAYGMDKALNVLDPRRKVQRPADPTHLTEGQIRKSYRADINSDMFPITTRSQTVEEIKVISHDVKAWCRLILKELMKDIAGDMNLLRSILH